MWSDHWASSHLSALLVRVQGLRFGSVPASPVWHFEGKVMIPRQGVGLGPLSL